jgi:DNA-binding response OmpR family regulator
MKTKILVVEDDPNIRFGLVELLSSEGYATESCERGNLALAAVERHRPSLVVLDIMLPGMNGYEVCKQLRNNGYRGLILMLTAKSQEMDKVIGLESGADDYVTKPFGLRELTARVHALLRRGRPAEDHAEERLNAGDLVLDLKTFELKRGDASVALSAREVKLLQFLLNHPGEVLSRDRILNEVWGYEYFANTRVLDQSVVQIRKKLAGIGANPKQLVTVHTVGYRWLREDHPCSGLPTTH